MSRSRPPLSVLDLVPVSAGSTAAEAIAARSPFSVCVTLAALRRAAGLGSLDAVLDQDRTLARAFGDEPDFREGVRALLVDKSNDPHWRHASLADVSRSELPPPLT